MIPPQSNIRINRQVIEQQIIALESVIGLKKRRIHCLEQRSLWEREWITTLDARTQNTFSSDPKTTGQAIHYTQALKDYYESEVQIMKVDLMHTEMELAIKKAMLQDGSLNLNKGV